MRSGTHEGATRRSMSPGYRTLSDKMCDVDNIIIHGIQTIQSQLLNDNNILISLNITKVKFNCKQHAGLFSLANFHIGQLREIGVQYHGFNETLR